MLEKRELAHGPFTPKSGPLEQGQPGSTDALPGDEYVMRGTLEEIHRRTMTLLRREVKPVPFSTYADFLAHWQHLMPDGRLSGPGALTTVLQQLRAAPVLGRIWERDVLPLRIKQYDRADLDTLCDQGEVVWVGSGTTDPTCQNTFAFSRRGQQFFVTCAG